MINYNHVVQFQHIFWDEQLKSAKTVVDATAGNGHDLVYLAQHCLPGSTLWASINRQRPSKLPLSACIPNAAAQILRITWYMVPMKIYWQQAMRQQP